MTKYEAASIVPEGLVQRLDTMVGWEPPESPRAAALKEAADVLRKLPTRQTDSDRLKDPLFVVEGYRIDTNTEAKGMRIIFFGEPDDKKVLAVTTLRSSDAYEFAQDILKKYDILEGIK